MLRATLVFLLLVHGLVHLLGVTSGFGIGKAPPFQKPVTPQAGVAWLLAAVLFVIAAALVIARVRLWYVPAAVGIVLSQALIVAWWKDAWFGTIANALLVAPVIFAASGAAAKPTLFSPWSSAESAKGPTLAHHEREIRP